MGAHATPTRIAVRDSQPHNFSQCKRESFAFATHREKKKTFIFLVVLSLFAFRLRPLSPGRKRTKSSYFLVETTTTTTVQRRLLILLRYQPVLDNEIRTLTMDNKSATTTNQRHILFDLSPIDPDTDEIEEKTQRCYQNLKQMIAGKSSKGRHEAYAKFIAANPPLHSDDLTMGLLVAILVDQENHHDCYGDVVAFSKDNLNLFASHMNLIITERITRLSNHSIRRIFWITRQLIMANVAATDNTCSNLIRQIAKGDVSPRNIFMVENLLDLLCDTRSWLVNTNTFIGPTVIFNLMRLIMDHSGVAQKALRRRETDFVIGLIRERFEFVLQIGKDFLRLLHHLTRVPEFQTLSQDIYVNNPTQLCPKYEGPHQLLAQRTPRRLFQSCLTYEMERKIQFLATGVNFGSQKRYQDWFTKQFLSGAESTLLRCDLIRYICTVIHPSNEVLCSNIIPRWAIIGWLLTTSIHVISSCRLALFLDWLAYDQTDNIMNIEPAILLMGHSIRAHPQVTASLLDFLCRAPAMFHPKISEQMRVGIKRSLQQILEKRVVQSLKPIFGCPKYDLALKTMIKESFPEYCQIDNGISPVVVNNESTPPSKVSLPPVNASQQLNPPVFQYNPANSANNPIAQPTTTRKPIEAIAQQPAMPQVIEYSDNTSSDESNVIEQSDTTLKVVPLDSEQQSMCNNQQATREPVSKVISTQPPTEALSNQQKTSLTLRQPDAKVNVVDIDRQIDDSSNDMPSSELPLPSPVNQRNATSKVATGSFEESATDYINCSDSESNSSDCQLIACGGSQKKQKLVLKESIISDLVMENKIQFSFMTIDRPFPTNNSDIVGETLAQLLEDLYTNRTNPDVISDIVAEIDCIREFDTQMIMTIGDCMAISFARDFHTRIYPSNDCDNKSLKDSITSPFFNLCSEAFSANVENDVSKPMALLAYVGGVLKSTGFLIIYYLRVQNILGATEYRAEKYNEFYNLRYPEEQANFFERDLQMMYDYDPGMLSLVLPLIFSSEFTSKFDIVNNHRVVRLAMSALDPISMNDLISYTMTCTTKVVNRDVTVKHLIRSSLEWPSWEQFSLWKIISAQNVPVESYLSILDELSAKQHAEAISAIMLNLQKIQEPDAHIVELVISSFGQGKEQFIASMLRHWAMKTDVKLLVKNIVSLLDQPPVKRKGQTKSTQKPMSALSYKTLGALDMVRLKGPKNKIFTQPELFESLSQVEPLCDELYKEKFAKLFDMQPKQTKKKKLDKDT